MRNCFYLADFKNSTPFIKFQANADVRYLCLNRWKKLIQKGIKHLSVFSQDKAEWAEIKGEEIQVDLQKIFQMW